MLVYLMESCIALRLFIFFILSVLWIVWFADLLIVSFDYWAPLVNFSLQVLYFSTLEFPFFKISIYLDSVFDEAVLW